MVARLRALWQGTRASYWFYPALFTLGAALLAILTLTVGRDEKIAALKLGIMPHVVAMIGGTSEFPKEEPHVIERVRPR